MNAPWISPIAIRSVYGLTRARLGGLVATGRIESRGRGSRKRYRWTGEPPAPANTAAAAPKTTCVDPSDALSDGVAEWSGRSRTLLLGLADLISARIAKDQKLIAEGKRPQMSVLELCRMGKLCTGLLERAAQGVAERSSRQSGLGLPEDTDGAD